MIPFVRLYTRRFHVTSKIFLRKISPKTSSTVNNQEFSENNIDVVSNCESYNSDYLGIESDEHVITVKPQKHGFQLPQKSNIKEKFYRTSFGIVRLDADNKLKYHGQYKRKKDFSFPHSSSKIVQVNNISQTLFYNNETVQCLSLKDSQTSEPSSLEKKDLDINYINECCPGTSEINDLAQDKIKLTTYEETNFLEKDETLVHSRNLSLGQDTSSYAGSEQKYDPAFYNKIQAEELNYLEKEFFGTLNNSENKSMEKDAAKNVDSDLNSKDQSEELNYFEKSYFEDFSNSKSHFIKQDISHYIDDELKVNSALDTTDENIFSINKSLSESCSLSNDQNSIHYDLMKSLSHSVQNNNITNKDIYSNSNEINHDGETRSQNEVLGSEFNNMNISELKKLTQKQTHEVNSKRLSSNKTQKIDTMSHGNIQPSVKNSNESDELYNESIKSFSKENKFKFSKLISEEPNQNNEIATAHDFVRKLREEQNNNINNIMNNNISKGKNTVEEKFDSKGFRILKNQVPNLSYFTHDEIIDILQQNIVYSDDDLVVLNKPYSLVIHESKTTKEPCLSTFLDVLAKKLDRQSTNPKLLTVHRLDKETTGCLLLARNETMAMHLKALFAQQKIVKKYWIITSRVPDPPEGVIDMPISEGSVKDRKRMVLHPKLPSDVQYKSHSKNGRPAVTTYKVISESGNAALVEVFPKTGVKHQIRVHFGFGLGCPILGDHKYSHLDKLVPQKLPSDMLQRLHVRQSKVRHIPMHIHAKSVGIPEYFDKRDLFVNIPIPNHFKINLKRLNFRKKDMIY